MSSKTEIEAIGDKSHRSLSEPNDESPDIQELYFKTFKKSAKLQKDSSTVN